MCIWRSQRGRNVASLQEKRKQKHIVAIFFISVYFHSFVSLQGCLFCNARLSVRDCRTCPLTLFFVICLLFLACSSVCVFFSGMPVGVSSLYLFSLRFAISTTFFLNWYFSSRPEVALKCKKNAGSYSPYVLSRCATTNALHTRSFEERKQRVPSLFKGPLAFID